MPGTRDPRKPKTPRYAGPEPLIDRIEFSPAPDAEDRLRRLFTLLASHLTANDLEVVDPDCLPRSSPAGDGDE